MSASRNRLGLAATAVATLLLLLLAPAPASAATVSVATTPGTPNAEVLSFTAAPGEDNDVSIGNSFGRPDQLRVTDAGAPLIAGPGCSVVAAPEPAVVCAWEPPRWPSVQPCDPPTKTCTRWIPGTGWTASFEVELGDGTNVFIANSLAGTYTNSVAMNVSSGAGDDHIATGGGEDVIDPGAGADLVYGGDGFDEFIATAQPDAPDVYESGPGTVGEVNYSKRTDPVLLEGMTAGAVGENDTLAGFFAVIGGSGADSLEGGPNVFWLEGGPGDDVLAGVAKSNFIYGGPGNDQLSANGEISHLIGEEGDDVSRGGPGVDIINDRGTHDTLGSKPQKIPSYEGGDDVAYGGGGGDAIGLGRGADRIFGSLGDDRIAGEAGADLLDGGPGPDRLIGGPGKDRVLGGSGSDVLFTGYWKWRPAGKDFPFAPAPTDGPDLADCGPGGGTAISNPWDVRRRCEQVRLVPAAAN